MFFHFDYYLIKKRYKKAYDIFISKALLKPIDKIVWFIINKEKKVLYLSNFS